MKIKNLKIVNFRNYESAEVSFHDNLNIIYGKNGQGKTNLVEAASYLSTLKSFRLHDDEDLIKQNAFFFAIEMRLENLNRNSSLRCVLSAKEKKMYYNGNEIKKVREFIGISNAIVFTSSDVYLFKDNPKKRRYFIDSELSKISPSYLSSLIRYQKLLKERNEILKQKEVNQVYLKVLTNQISQQVHIIVNKRINFLNLLEEKVSKKYQEFSLENRKITFKYKSDFKNDMTVESINNLYERFVSKEINRQVTLIGPHKDDLIVCIDDKDIEVYGSQGQQRLVAIALKLALLEVVKDQTGENPIVIFDDVMSELDESKRKKLLDSLATNMQIFITTANVSEISKFINSENANYYLVDNGTIRLTEGS